MDRNGKSHCLRMTLSTLKEVGSPRLRFGSTQTFKLSRFQSSFLYHQGDMLLISFNVKKSASFENAK